MKDDLFVFRLVCDEKVVGYEWHMAPFPPIYTDELHGNKSLYQVATKERGFINHDLKEWGFYCDSADTWFFCGDRIEVIDNGNKSIYLLEYHEKFGSFVMTDEEDGSKDDPEQRLTTHDVFTFFDGEDYQTRQLERRKLA